MELAVLGTHVRVDTSRLQPDQRAHLHRLWEWCISDTSMSPPDPDIHLARRADDVPGTVTKVMVDDWDAAPYRISGAVTISALTKRVGSDLLFHAAGLADAQGRVVVLVAPSGTGKTTAARTLGTELGYVSDETVAIRRDGTVTAHPKPLSVVRGENRARKVEFSPAEAGLRRPPGELVFGRLVLLTRDPGLEGDALVEELDVLDAAVQAAAQTSGLVRLESALDWLARTLTTGGGPVNLRYREIGHCGDIVRGLLAGSEPAAQTWTHHPPSGANEPPAEGTWTRRPHVDAIGASGRVLVLNERGVTLLDGVGAVAWHACGEGATPSEIVDLAVAEFGPHPDAPALVDAALEHLSASGMVQRNPVSDPSA